MLTGCVWCDDKVEVVSFQAQDGGVETYYVGLRRISSVDYIHSLRGKRFIFKYVLKTTLKSSDKYFFYRNTV